MADHSFIEKTFDFIKFIFIRIIFNEYRVKLLR